MVDVMGIGMPLKSARDFMLQYGAFIRLTIKLVTSYRLVKIVVLICPLMSGIRDAVPTSRVILLPYLDLVSLLTIQSFQIVWIEYGWKDETSTQGNLPSSSNLTGYNSCVIFSCTEIP